jgi:hypothetical protein
VVGSRHPAAAAGTPMCGRDPSGARARSAGDKRQRAAQGGQIAGWFWPDTRPVFGQIYAPFLAKIYAQKAFLENAASITWRISWGVYYVAYIFMDLRSVQDTLASRFSRLVASRHLLVSRFPAFRGLADGPCLLEVERLPFLRFPATFPSPPPRPQLPRPHLRSWLQTCVEMHHCTARHPEVRKCKTRRCRVALGGQVRQANYALCVAQRVKPCH